MANTDYRSEQLVTSVRLMIGRRVAGLAAIVSEMAPELIDELNESRTPVVFYDVGTPRHNITNIRVNYRRGIEKVVDYLHSLGHRRLGFIGHHAMLGPINERMKAVLDAVARIPSLEVRTAADADTLEGGRQATRALLSTGFEPTAIICVNDVTAVGALRELRERGTARAAGYFGYRLRQRQALRILLSRADHRAHSARPHRPHYLRLPDAEARQVRYREPGDRDRPRVRGARFHRPGAGLTAC